MVPLIVTSVLSNAAFATGDDIYFSLRGQFQDGVTDVQQFFIDLTEDLESAGPVRLRTYHHDGTFGLTNLAGDTISAGGFDPAMRLFDNAEVVVAENDDFAALAGDAQVFPSSLLLADAAGPYRLDMFAQYGSLEGFTADWTVELSADLDAGLRLVGLDGTDSTVQALRIGNTGSGNPLLRISDGSSATVDGLIAVGHTGQGSVVVNEAATLMAGDVTVGFGVGTSGSVVTSGASSNLSVADNFTVGFFGTASVQILNDSSINVGNVLNIGNGGSVLLDTGGTLNAKTVDPNNGTLTLSGGELITETVSGSLTNSGTTISPGGSAGKTTITGSYIQNLGTLNIELGGLAPGSDHDQLVVENDLTLWGGGLEVSLIDDFTPDFDQAFTIVSVNGTGSGQFSNLLEGALVGDFGGVDLFVTYQGNGKDDIVLFSEPEPFPCDFNTDSLCNAVDIDLLREAIIVSSPDPIFNVNGDTELDDADFEFMITFLLGTGIGDVTLNNIVNFEDFSVLSNNFGADDTGWAQGNVNLDSTTNFEDFVGMANNFGLVFTSGSPIPEPTIASSLPLLIALIYSTKRKAEYPRSFDHPAPNMHCPSCPTV